MSALAPLSAAELKRLKVCPVKCPLHKVQIASLADYFATISRAVGGEQDRDGLGQIAIWFRGHADANYHLTPTALRPKKEDDRSRAVGLMAEFRRIAEIKLPRPPANHEELMWAQIAQHYGLPTKLLDWTESATTALFFACLRSDVDGIVFVINPESLNKLTYPTKPRVLDPRDDAVIIKQYLRTSVRKKSKGRMPVAINPVWNSERLVIQKGVFTLHGSVFSLDDGVPSLAAVPILREAKPLLRSELQRIGTDEMTLFPELEHACTHLKRRAGLCGWE